MVNFIVNSYDHCVEKKKTRSQCLAEVSEVRVLYNQASSQHTKGMYGDINRIIILEE